MYPNQAFLKEIGITPQEFVYLTRMSSWAVCINPTKTADASDGSKAIEPAGEEEHHVEADKELDELRYVAIFRSLCLSMLDLCLSWKPTTNFRLPFFFPWA